MVTVFLLFALILLAFVWVFLKWGGGSPHIGRRSLDFALPPDAHLFRGPESRRRTERFPLVLPIHVTGQDAKGEAFAEDTHTKQLSGYGASIVLNRQLRPEQEIVIRRENRSQEATCRVVYEVERVEAKHIYGVAFVNPSVDLWGVCNLLTEALASPKP